VDDQPLVTVTESQESSGNSGEQSLPLSVIAPAVGWVLLALVRLRFVGQVGVLMLALPTAVWCALDCAKLRAQRPPNIGIAFKPVVVFAATAFFFGGFGFIW
jgi:hypothetical protein